VGFFWCNVRCGGGGGGGGIGLGESFVTHYVERRTFDVCRKKKRVPGVLTGGEEGVGAVRIGLRVEKVVGADIREEGILTGGLKSEKRKIGGEVKNRE